MPVPTKPKAHTSQELENSSVDVDSILKSLKERAFRLGGYKDAYQCLFRGPADASVSSTHSESDRTRKFSFEGNQRVSSSTTANFDFLLMEETMAHVVLSLEYSPELLKDLPVDETDRTPIFQRDHANLKSVFKWLKGTKGVKSIIHLIVKENPLYYCSDDTVEQCLKGLDVRYLSWNRPDLCAETLRVVPSLIEVSLTWSGLNAVLWSWSDTHGLQTLKQLHKVHLYVKRGIESHLEQDKKIENFITRVEQWDRGDNFEFPRLQIHIENDDGHFDGDGSGSGLGPSPNILVHPWLQTVSEFADKLKTIYKNVGREFHVKVALLDDGVDPTYKRLGEKLHHAGWPTSDGEEYNDNDKNFYVSTNNHGSKMAYLFQLVCPFVTIYVAKLDVQDTSNLRQRTFNLKQATKAIQWAKAQGVDIISMSWNARRVEGEMGNEQEVKVMEKVIGEVAQEDILMFGAACDFKESGRNERWVPCDSPHVNSIGATDKDFDVKKYVDLHKKVDYLFPGEHLLSQPEDNEVGNSGATALAAGLAALVLFCMKVSREKIPQEKLTWMKNIMAHVFRSQTESKVVYVKDILKMDDKDHMKQLITKFAAQRG
ncbi:peptidase S8/S53 domain-containing protein [Xylariaceae sp. FL0255]|nr:peptidase S8/S53 domain-containing protein [Xylariaceae sp. FL0255]